MTRFGVGALLIVSPFVLLSGCDHVMVTGRDGDDPTFKGNQSETASAEAFSRGQDVFVITYNDGTDDGKVVYTADDRVVFPGASLLGWSYSTDRGKTWTYGGKVSPPSGIDILWGDPAITVPRLYSNRVYISSLAAAQGKIPPTGHHGWLTDNTLTGACIARSDDGGIHFAIQSYLTADGDFYDGGSLAAGTGDDERIFAAYWDVPHSRIDVWASPDGIAAFVRIAGNPFPGMIMISHPLLAYDPINGDLIVAAIAAIDAQHLFQGHIYMNRLVGDTWGQPVLASQLVTGVVIKVGSQTIRSSPDFSFDVGTPSQTEDENGNIRVNDDAIRLLYCARDAETHRIYIRGTALRADLGVMRDMPEWGTTPGNLNTPGEQWNPTVTSWQGYINLPPVWKATYLSTDDDPNRVSVKQGNLVRLPNGTAVFLPFNLVSARSICPDLRGGTPGNATGGYWGDYDVKAFAGFSKDSTTPEFMVAFSDSCKGCVSQSKFTSTHVHVSASVFK